MFKTSGKCLILLTAFWLSTSFCFTQNIDSLWTVFNNREQADTNRLNAIQKAARALLSVDPDSAIHLANKELNLLKYFNNNSYQKWEARSQFIIGGAYMDKGDFFLATEKFLIALSIFKEIDSKIWIANCYGNLGIVNSYQSNYTKALEYYFKQQKICEEIQDLKGLANSYQCIGTIYQNQLNSVKALEYYQKGLKLAISNNDKRAQGYCYLNIATVYARQADYKKAMIFYEKTLPLFEETKNLRGISLCYNNIGSDYSNQSNFSKALVYYYKCLKITRELDDKHGSSTCYLNLGQAYNKLHDYSKSLKYCDSALKLSKEIGYLNDQRHTYSVLAETYSNMGNYKLAYENHIKFKKINDSIFNEENSKQIGDLKTRAEVEKKEVELKLKSEAEKEKLTAKALEEKKVQNVIIRSVIGVLILVVIFSIFLFNRFQITNKQKKIITEQKQLVEEKHKEITDSINYAERIQRSFIATEEILDDNLNDYFVLFKPKDVVSGDFYWASKLNNGNFALATADSTGHGVPGAIMSLLNITSLEKAIETLNNPSDILNSTRKTIIERLKKDGSIEGGKDGMDCSFICFDFKKKKIIAAAANNPVWIVRGTETVELKPDKMPVGKHDKDNISFTQQEIQLQKGDVIYTLTDGFPDQFGGAFGKKFMSKNLRELLSKNSHLPMKEQKSLLEKTFKAWVGNLEQVDDVTIVGVRI